MVNHPNRSKMQLQYHEGQEVEVRTAPLPQFGHGYDSDWRKAKIVAWEPGYGSPIAHQVQFPDGSRAVFDAEHIRAALPPDEMAYDPEGINKAIRNQLVNQK